MVGGKQGEHTGTWVCWEWEDSVKNPLVCLFGCAAGQQLDCVVRAEPAAHLSRAVSRLEQGQGHAAPGSPVWMMPPHPSVGSMSLLLGLAGDGQSRYWGLLPL